MSKDKAIVLFDLIALNAVLIIATGEAGWSLESRVVLALLMFVVMLGFVRGGNDE